MGDTTAPTIGDLKITTKGVEKQLSTLNINRASGPDQIPNIFLKQTAKESASVLAALFTQSLQTENLPGDWLEIPFYNRVRHGTNSLSFFGTWNNLQGGNSYTI